MSKGKNQKLKLLYLSKIMLEKTDDEHKLTMPEILAELARYGVTAERKSIYDDFEALRVYGMDIIKEKKGRGFVYYVGNRDFELPELKLLVDAVQSSKFITETKSNQLIKKLEKYTSKYEAKKLNRHIFVHGRVKNMNESIYYNVDKIFTAIADNVKIRFQYFQWDVNKEMVLRHDGAIYEISPWELVWDNENYYMIGYDTIEECRKHFRVDKMLHIEITEDKREGAAMFEKTDMAAYGNKRFSMYDGKEQRIKLEFTNNLAGVVIDRFGKNVMMYKTDEEHFIALIDVAVSPQFFGWIMSLGTEVKVLEPEDVVKQIKQEIESIQLLYEKK